MRKRIISWLFCLVALFVLTSRAYSTQTNRVLAQNFLEPQQGWRVYSDSQHQTWVRRTQDGGIH